MRNILGNGAFCIIWTIREDRQISVLLQRGPDRDFFELSGGSLEYEVNNEHPEDEGLIFERALIREVREELGLNLDTSQIKLEAALQQLKIVDETTRATGCVFLYSCFVDKNWVESTPLDKLVLQPDEVEEVRWWDIGEAITTTHQSPGEDFVGLSFRRMLIIFNNRDEQTGPYQGNLGQPLKFMIEEGGQVTPRVI
jgi:8-oxo-dGTP pyrophosphatase MutT (NUDIX family)